MCQKIVLTEEFGDNVVEMSYKELWGTNLKKVSNFPLREFADVHNFICPPDTVEDSKNRSFLNGGSDYGDSNGIVIIHLYNNVNGDLILEVLDGSIKPRIIDGRAVVAQKGTYCCNTSDLSKEDMDYVSTRLKNILAYCNKNNVDDVYILYTMHWESMELAVLCDFLVRRNKHTLKEYMKSKECKEYYKSIGEEDIEDIEDNVFDIKENLVAYVSRYNTSNNDFVGSESEFCVKHSKGSYCLVLAYQDAIQLDL